MGHYKDEYLARDRADRFVPVRVEELRHLREIAAAARVWCHTYAVRDLTEEEMALMMAVAGWENSAFR